MPSASFPDLDGASVFVTGGGSGIGAALTEGFVAQGARVAFVQRSDAAEFAADLGRRYGRTPLFLHCDVTDIPALQAAMAEAAAAHGPITVLVNNAANDQRHPVEGYTVEEWDAAQAVNLRPHFFTAQAAIPGMKAAGGGRSSTIPRSPTARRRRLPVLRRRQGGDHRPDLRPRPHARARQHPRQRHPARARC